MLYPLDPSRPLFQPSASALASCGYACARDVRASNIGNDSAPSSDAIYFLYENRLYIYWTTLVFRGSPRAFYDNTLTRGGLESTARGRPADRFRDLFLRTGILARRRERAIRIVSFWESEGFVWCPGVGDGRVVSRSVVATMFVEYRSALVDTISGNGTLRLVLSSVIGRVGALLISSV